MSGTRAPRGSGNLKKAFFEAAKDIPDDRRTEVLKAAVASIREELKAEILKAKKARQKERIAAGGKPLGRPRLKAA